MKKVLFSVICAFLLIPIIFATASCSCDKSEPQFEGDPISLTGNLRWKDGVVLLDYTITNNTNRGIQVYNFVMYSSSLIENEQDWHTTIDGAERFLRDSDKWYDKLLKGPTIKAGASKNYSTLGGIATFQNMNGPDTYAVACKLKITVTWLEFEGYGRMDLDEPLVYEFEWYKES